MFGFNNKKRILIIGMPDLVLYCISALKRANKKIVGVITSPPDNPTYDFMVDFLKQNRLLHIENNKNFKDKNLLKQVKELAPDIALVCSFNYLLPKELYEIPKLGTLNFHPSFLPDYRGANPYFHVINNGEKETGVTLHFIDETFDTGDIVTQVKVPIFDNDTMGTLFNRQNEVTAKLCVDTVNFIEKNGALPRIKQTNTKSLKIAPKIHAETDEVKINWDKSIMEIERFIRALNPFFGATAFFNGTEVKIWSVEIIENKSVEALPTGTICDIADESIFISAKDGFIKTKIISVGEETYFSKTQDIVNITKIQKGDRV